MGLIQYLILCVVVGVLDYLVITYVPMPQQIKNLIVVVSVIVLILILLSAMGIFGFDIGIPRLK